jgi:hypothetical protein
MKPEDTTGISDAESEEVKFTIEAKRGNFSSDNSNHESLPRHPAHIGSSTNSNTSSKSGIEDIFHVEFTSMEV